jgi:hypothetical protein
MSIELYVILALAAVAFGMGLVRAFHAVEEARRRVVKVTRAKRGQVDRLRRAGRSSLNLKRAIRDGKRRLEQTLLDVEEAEAAFNAAEGIDHRLFVLDDRRTKVDQSWIAALTHPDYADAINHNALPELVKSWQKGRRFLVFAVDVQKVREKVLARFPERLGYRVVSITPQTVQAPASTPAPAKAPAKASS